MNTTDRILGEAMTPRQKRIYKDPEKAVAWATKHQQRFPEAEPYILKATDPPRGWTMGLAYHYARAVLKGRWPEAEEAIAKDPRAAYEYANHVIKGRWPEAESVIATDPFSAHRYAKYVLKGRFPEGEATIAKDPDWAYYYAVNVIKGRFPEGEPAIAKDYSTMYLKQFPEAKLEWAMNGLIDWLDL